MIYLQTNYTDLSTKASCTLDASVKIYSNRVDDTYATSHRILESLSRNGPTPDESEQGNEEANPAKKKVRMQSSRLNIATTIEKSPENLNTVKLEHEYSFDPMFQKMSKAFDEGGAKGMLLYNMVGLCKFSLLKIIFIFYS